MAGRERTETEPTTDAAAKIAKDLVVKGSGLTRLVEIVAESPHPELAADFVNTLAAEYIEQNMENRWDSTKKTGEFLTKKVAELRGRLEAAEVNLQAYAQSAQLVFTSEKDNVALEQLRRLETELADAHADKVKKQTRYEQALSSKPDSVSDVMENPEFRENRAKLIELRRQSAALSTSMTPEHPSYQKLEAQIKSLSGEVQGTRDNVLQRIKNDYEQAQRREKMLYDADMAQRRVLGDQLSKETRYNLLKRDVDSTRLMYDSMLQKLKEVGVAEAMPASGVRIVDAAKAPSSRPAQQHPECGSRAGVRSPCRDGRRFRAPALRPVPAAPGEAVPTRGAGDRRRAVADQRSNQASRRLKRWGGGETDENGRALTVQQNPNFGLAEGKRKRDGNVDLALVFRDRSVMAGGVPRRAAGDPVRQRAGQPAHDGGHKREPAGREDQHGEQSRHRARGPEQARPADRRRRPQPTPARGLRPFQRVRPGRPARARTARSQIRRIPAGVDRLLVLPVGKASEQTKNLLHSPKLVELLKTFEEDYDIVLIDTAPALHMRDARLLGSLADGVVLIVRAGHTSRDAASAVIDKFRQDGTPVLGVILNDWKPESSDPVYGKEYMNGYRHYYGQ